MTRTVYTIFGQMDGTDYDITVAGSTNSYDAAVAVGARFGLTKEQIDQILRAEYTMSTKDPEAINFLGTR